MSNGSDFLLNALAAKNGTSGALMSDKNTSAPVSPSIPVQDDITTEFNNSPNTAPMYNQNNYIQGRNNGYLQNQSTDQIISFVKDKTKEYFGDRLVRPEASTYKFKREFSDYVQKTLLSIKEASSQPALRTYLQNTIVNDILGLGVLQPLIDNQDITEIEVKNFKEIYVEMKGKLALTDIKFDSEESLRGVISKIVQPIGKSINKASPSVDARLSDGSRVCAAIPPISPDGATLSIRKFAQKKLTEEDYLNYNSASKEILNFLHTAVVSGCNIILSGGTGTGKTSALNLLSNYIPESEAVITIEDTCELKLQQQNVRRLEARSESAEGKGAITIRDLVKLSLRMRPDRICVGEVRDGTIIDLMSAMSTGHEGSMSTVHANSPDDLVYSRFPQLFGMADMPMSEKAQSNLVCSAIDIIVQLERDKLTGRRTMSHITAVCGLGSRGAKIAGETDYIESDRIYLKDMFVYNSIKDAFESTGFLPEKLRMKFIKAGYKEYIKKEDE